MDITQKIGEDHPQGFQQTVKKCLPVGLRIQCRLSAYHPADFDHFRNNRQGPHSWLPKFPGLIQHPDAFFQDLVVRQQRLNVKTNSGYYVVRGGAPAANDFFVYADEI